MSTEYSTQLALLFPLKAGLFPCKSDTLRTSDNESSSSAKNIAKAQTPIRIRRRSSLPELDKLSATGSIGDLMNQKRYSGSCSSRETLIARTVPLSTVTSRSSLNDTDFEDGPMISTTVSRSRYSPSYSSRETLYSRTTINRTSLETIPDMLPDNSPRRPPPPKRQLSALQRTEKLSKLIRQQRSTNLLHAATLKQINVSILNINLFWEIGREFILKCALACQFHPLVIKLGIKLASIQWKESRPLSIGSSDIHSKISNSLMAVSSLAPISDYYK